ncbi:hypothetical protein RHMOL_Rhmol03G0062000 [Rhododendron molle]|uniref:Uncharacterized protein n=1 Tax=Rhododendron molle TaxID=49168 RepID=A0ACC0PB47_RHOML|nr:hypothetical protein RHMOL_Rhmol03G0062000 [Rhododendron molle]
MLRIPATPMGILMVTTLVICCCCGLMSIAEGKTYVKYRDPEQPLNARIKDLMRRMSLEEKIGQMVQIERSVASAEVMKKYFIGSVLSGGGSGPAKHASAKRWIKMVNKFQKGSMSTRLGIPMIYGIDAVHGHNNVYKATIFPHNIGLGATRQVCRDPRWGRCYESYSEDHKIVEAMTEIIPGLQGEIPVNYRKGVPFVAGKPVQFIREFKLSVENSNNQSHVVSDELDFNTSEELVLNYHDKKAREYLMNIKMSIGVTSGIVLEKRDEVLESKGKGDMEGIDWITSPPHANYTYSIQAGIQAGIDMDRNNIGNYDINYSIPVDCEPSLHANYAVMPLLQVMVPFNYTEFIDGLTVLVKKRIITMSRIDDAVRRILRVKFVMGLFENPFADRSLANQLGRQEHRKLAREAVRKSLVLLKNGVSAAKPLLPLPKKASKILVAGSHADNLGYQCGGWTMEWQGVSGNNLTTGTTILTAIRRTVDPTTDVVHKENPSSHYVKSGKFSYAIVVVGEHPYAETNGDSLNLTIPYPGPSTIRNVCGSLKCVVIIISGRPVVIQPHLASIDTLIAAWLPGTEGQGVADVLFGDYGFTGKLPITWFKTVDQLPMKVEDTHYDPLFPFGYGLSTKPTGGNY